MRCSTCRASACACPTCFFTHRDTGHRVYFEVLGFWSREAVWRRVDLVNAGLPHPIVFAVSSRLRVSEEVLDSDLPGQLYVYKGAIGARAVEQRLDASLARADSGDGPGGRSGRGDAAGL